MMAIDPDPRPADLEVPPDTPGAADGDYGAVEPDVEDVADLSSVPSSDMAKTDVLRRPAGDGTTSRQMVRWYDARSGLHRTACALPTSSQKCGFHKARRFKFQ